MGKETFTYEKEGLRVIWQPKLCIHSRKCWQMLPQVFAPANRPWVNIEGASVENIIEQIAHCPSGALSYQLPEKSNANNEDNKNGIQVRLSENGPLLMEGNISISKSDGSRLNREGKVAFCRCGGSASKPFCDGSHLKNGFKD